MENVIKKCKVLLKDANIWNLSFIYSIIGQPGFHAQALAKRFGPLNGLINDLIISAISAPRTPVRPGDDGPIRYGDYLLYFEVCPASFFCSFFSTKQCNASLVKRVEKHLLHEIHRAFFRSPDAHLLTRWGSLIRGLDRAT